MSRNARTDPPATGESAAGATDGRRGVGRPSLDGAVGGFLGTVTMTVYRLPLFDGLPPTAEFWARFVGDGDPSEYPFQALALHLLYGSGAGSVLALALSRVDLDRRGHRTTAAGVAFGAVLSAFGSRVLLRRLLGIRMDARESLVFHAGHLVYGLSLGTWIGTEGTIGRSGDAGRVEDGDGHGRTDPSPREGRP